MGTIYRWQVDADNIAVANFGGGNREATVPFGLEGGKAAPQHQLYLKKGDETIDVDAESFYDYSSGDIFEIYQSGGGGFGNPLKRAVARVKDDVVNGCISAENAREDYGVVIDPESFEVDEAETRALRG